jgi:cell wall-associated NlpC family hydrolase
VVVALALVVVLFVAVLIPVAILSGGAIPMLTQSATQALPRVESGPLPGPQSGRTSVQAQPQPAVSFPPAASAAVAVAYRYLGVRYVFGGSDPSIGLDCSGLVQLVFRQLGIGLPRTAQLQYNATVRVPADQLQPGDLVFFARTYADPNDWITHVGIYIGNGQQINAPTEGQVVSVQPVFTGFWGAHLVSGGRIRAG